MKWFKRILAIIALFFAVVFITMIMLLLVTGKMADNGNMVIWPLTIFLGLGMICLGINWVENQIKAAKAAREQNDPSAQ